MAAPPRLGRPAEAGTPPWPARRLALETLVHPRRPVAEQHPEAAALPTASRTMNCASCCPRPTRPRSLHTKHRRRPTTDIGSPAAAHRTESTSCRPAPPDRPGPHRRCRRIPSRPDRSPPTTDARPCCRTPETTCRRGRASRAARRARWPHKCCSSSRRPGPRCTEPCRPAATRDGWGRSHSRPGRSVPFPRTRFHLGRRPAITPGSPWNRRRGSRLRRLPAFD